MTPVPQFIVTFRGAEVGRYETADRAMAAARSVIDTEMGSRAGSGDREPGELPRIEWQPPRVPFPFDGFAYWRQRSQSQKQDGQQAQPAPQPPAPTSPPTVAPTVQVSLKGLGAPANESMLPRGQERFQPSRPPAPVYGGPPPQWQPPQPQQQPQPQPQQPQPHPQQQQPAYSGPLPQWGAQPPPPLPAQPSEQPKTGKRRWFGKDRGRTD